MKRKSEWIGWLVPLMLIILIGSYYLNAVHSSIHVQEVDPFHAALKEYDALNISSLPQLTIWSSDFHISPIADLKFLLKDFNVRIIDKSLSGHCHLSDTCATDLKVITQSNGIHLNPCPNRIRREFYEAYRNDPEFMSVDAILCTHAISMCELFMPFGKPLIMLASTRYEIGRHDRSEWDRWNQNLQLIAKKEFNTIAANNLYDSEYVKYFTSVASVPVLPSYCEYVNTVYKPQRGKPFLLAPSRGVNRIISSELQASLRVFNTRQDTPLTITPIRELYPLHFEYSDLASHPAIVLLPYQVSVMSLFEFYRMAIPLFVPSLSLLTEWHVKHQVLNERTWNTVYGHPARQSALPRHPNSTSSMQTDPNNEFDLEAVREWLALSDFYQWPHVRVFRSFDDLFQQLKRTNLATVSEDMKQYNVMVKRHLETEWRKILEKIYAFKKVHGRISQSLRVGDSELLPKDINDALLKEYGIRLSETDCSRQHLDIER